MNTEQLLQNTVAELAEAEYELERWLLILRATDISQTNILVVCREALAAWKTKHDQLMGQISYLTNATELALH
ncbi:MAG: hypothetical protein QM578_11765 [Pantoea sp.]|uniref:hypothetical protein n=1 Tax=Pantoea sp. TaxID=69393 RepID=UPI0039E4F57E